MTEFPVKGMVALIILLQVFLQGNFAQAQQSDCVLRLDLGPLSDQVQQLRHSEHAQFAEKIEVALENNSLNECERALLHSYAGRHYYELDRLGAAIEHFQAAIDSNGLAQDQRQSLELNVAQLKIANGDYLAGTQMLLALVEQSGNENPEFTYMAVTGLIQAKEYEAALPLAEQWFERISPKERKHYDLLNFLYSKLERPEKREIILQEMVIRWPQDRQLWHELISTLTAQGKTADAFEAQKILYLNGMIFEENELLQFIDVYSDFGMPFQAAEILDRELSSGRISATTENYIKLSKFYEASKEAKIALQAFEKGAKLTDSSDIWIDYGQALCAADRFEDGERAFLTAQKNVVEPIEIWPEIAKCRYAAAATMPVPNCSGRYNRRDITQARRFIQNQKAIEAFENVPITSRHHGTARKSIADITAENETYKHRCEDYGHPHVDLCFRKLENAYKLEIIRGVFYLSKPDQHCLAYKDSYDEKYRTD